MLGMNLSLNKNNYIESLLKRMTDHCGLLFAMTDLENDKINSYNAIKTETTWQMADKYATIIAADTNNILYDIGGNEKILIIANINNITNDQFFFDETTGKTLFFETELIEPCYTYANRWMEFLEVLYDSENNRLFDSENDPLYALKDGITREV